MPTWLDMIRIEAENLDKDKLMEPPSELDPDRDHLVADAEIELRRLYSLAIHWEKTAMEMILAARYMNDDSKRENSARKASQLAEKAQLLMKIFWVSIKDTYELWDKPSVGIRKGWKVVWTDPDPVPPILGILGDLLGGGR